MNRITFCDCADDSVAVLAARLSAFDTQKDIAIAVEEDIRKMANGSMTTETIAGMIDVICHVFANLPPAGKRLIDGCINFLATLQHWRRDNVTFLRRDQTGFHKEKPIFLSTYISNCLGISRNSGYDWWLMCYLSHYDITEHGGNVGGSWLADDWANRPIPDAFTQSMYQWAERAPDDM